MIWRTGLTALASAGIFTSVATACPAPVEASEIELFPSGAMLPENLLRVYIYFPRRMGTNFDSSDIMLTDASGDEVTDVFLPMRFELWSPDRQRLTLLLDPGRVKTGLVAHDALGRALVSGETYTLTIPDDLADSDGCGLGNTVSFSFAVAAPDREPPSPGDWQFEPPAAASKSALRIDLGSPHDHLSMAYRIRVITADGEAVPGEIAITQDESVWEFAPRQVWEPSEYRIVIDPRLEDLAGNRPGVPFDRPAEGPTESAVSELIFVPH
ncbi:MAG: hypothetical protein AAGJ84_14325 [Pseudomonadota bacterium]